MSEHTRVIGKVEYDHLPYREEGFSWCRHCKQFVNKMEVCFNEGWMSDWMQVNCGKCRNAIWVCEFKLDPRKDMTTPKKKLARLKKLKGLDLEVEIMGCRTFPKDDKKCFICKKKLSHYDCSSHYYGGPAGKKSRYICRNKKCMKADEKLHNAWVKKIKQEEKQKDGRIRKKS